MQKYDFFPTFTLYILRKNTDRQRNALNSFVMSHKLRIFVGNIEHFIMRDILLLLATLFAWSIASRANITEDTISSCPEEKLEIEWLPDMNIPRAAHYTLCINGQITVFGGHTSGFIPTPTAEYLSRGEWHLMNMVYTHDNPIVLPLTSGKVLLAGGLAEPLGIGQSFWVEEYDPKTYQFEGFGCLDTKRAMGTAIETSNGDVLISGNWYHDDNIECFKPSGKSSFVDSVSCTRACPMILQTDSDNYMIFSATDNHGKQLEPIIVDQLHGQPFVPPLFDTWKVVPFDMFTPMQDSFVGDADAGIYSYLFMVVNADSCYAIARTDGTDFSLLPTRHPIPSISKEGSRIIYSRSVLVDRKTGRGYVMGYDSNCRNYVLAVDYLAGDSTECPITLYYTDPIGINLLNGAFPILDTDGCLVIAGGIGESLSNFDPHARACRLRVNPSSIASTDIYTPSHSLQYIMIVIVLIATIVALMCLRHKKTPSVTEETDNTARNERKAADAGTHDETLMERIDHLIVDKKLYLNSDLKIQDVATMLGTNSRYVSNCINENKDCSFSQYVNRFRIDYAKRIIRQSPDTKMLAVAIESGFANETSFFRTFKQITGTSPKQWIAGEKIKS